MACCWSRGAEGLLPASRDSDFDRQVLVGFGKVLDAGGVIRTSPGSIQRRSLTGTLGVVVQFSAEHFNKKRKPPESQQQQVVGTVDPEAFNFTKVDPAEKLLEVEAIPQDHPDGGLTMTVLANVSPLATGHVLFVPNCGELLPQVLTEHLLLGGLRVLAKSTRHDFRLVFNSLMGFASVNHFHFHGLYLNYCGLPDSRLPIEKVERSIIAGGTTEGRAALELLVEGKWYVRGFVVTAGCAKGTPGASPPADIAALASLTSRVVLELQKRNIPHNVILAPPSGRKPKRAQAAGGLANEETAKPEASSPEIYILPRQPEGSLREDAGFNAAICEMSGLVIAGSEETFKSLSEESVQEIFKSDVSIPEPAFDELICKVAWLPI